jgi:hypothetical protein
VQYTVCWKQTQGQSGELKILTGKCLEVRGKFPIFAAGIKRYTIMNTTIFKEMSFRHPIILIDRDDGNKNKALETEARLPRV